MKKVLFSLAVIAMAVGCAKVDEGSVPSGFKTLHVSSDGATRTEIVTDDDVTFLHNWVKGDAIALYDASDALRYELVGDGGSTTGDFTGPAPVKQTPPYYAFYPYGDVIDVPVGDPKQVKFLYDFPSEIEYAGTPMVGSNVMIGFTGSDNLVMKNACSYVRVSLLSAYVGRMEELVIVARGGESIAGPHYVCIGSDGIPFVEEAPSAPGLKPDYSTVTIKFPERIGIYANATEFYIPLPPVELSQGLAFILKGDFAGEPTINITSSTATLERNTVLVMEEYKLPSEEARIGEVIYETVADAFAAANASDEDVTITILRTCFAGSPLILDDTGAGKVTLNLNGKALHLDATNNIKIYGRNFTVSDAFSADPAQQGSIIASPANTGSYSVRIEDGGHLFWTGGNMKTTGYRAIYVTTGSNATFSGGTIVTEDQIAIAPGASAGTVNITGDILISTGATNSVYMWGGVVNMDGGTVVNTSGAAIYAYSNGSVANVSGGYISSGAVNPVGMSSGVCYVTGGCYNKAIQVPHATSPSGTKYVNTLNPDPATSEEYPFMVVPSAPTPAARGERGSYVLDFESFECAAKNASSTLGINSVTLTSDVAVTSTAVFSNASYAMTLDLNGKRITGDVSPVIRLASGSNLTILDSSDEGSGEVVSTGTTALETAGSLNYNAGSLVALSNAVRVTGGNFNVFGGYFYGGTSSDISVLSGKVTLSSGRYRNQPDANMFAEGCGPKPDEKSYNGRTYGYRVVTTDVAAEVNGEGYASLGAAVAAARAYNGSDASVSIKLFKPAVCSTAITITNENGKPVVLDLNGQTVTTDVYQFISVTGNLLITDSSSAPGSIESSNARVLYLHGTNGTSTVTVEKITIRSSFDKSKNSETGAAANSALYAYSNASGTSTLNLQGGAKIVTPKCHGFYGGGNANSTPAFFNIHNAEMTAGCYCFYFSTATVTISGDETSLYTYDLDGSGLSYCGTSNSNGACTINGGYFSRAGGTKAPFNTNYAGHYTFGGGYFNAAPGGKYKLVDGYSIKDCSVTHVHKTTGEELSYTKKAAK